MVYKYTLFGSGGIIYIVRIYIPWNKNRKSLLALIALIAIFVSVRVFELDIVDNFIFVGLIGGLGYLVLKNVLQKIDKFLKSKE